MKRSKKATKRLEQRMAGYAQSMNTRNTEAGGTQQRKETGGFRQPGSNNK